MLSRRITTRLAARFDRALSSGTLELECRITRGDGAVRWIDARGRVEYAPGGEPVRMAGIVMDITDRRRTEDALHQAQKMEAIGQLTGGVAHDFNNLLTVIVGGLDMMIRRPERTDRVVRLAEAAMTAARRGEQLTQQLLAFSRRQMSPPRGRSTPTACCSSSAPWRSARSARPSSCGSSSIPASIRCVSIRRSSNPPC